jgi:Uma2 family endonuclease
MSTLTTPTSPAAPPALMTADEFAATHTQIRAELVKGVVKGYPMPGTKHGKICMKIGALIYHHVEAGDLGHVMSNDTWVKTGSDPDTVRGADVCFVSYGRLPKDEVPDGVVPVAPDLVVEVRSPSDRWNDIFIKVGEYLRVGVRAVVVLDPKTTSATVYRDEEFQQTFHNGDSLTLPDVLPGFSVTVSSLFG